MQKARNLRYCQNICKRSIREGIPSGGALIADMRPQRILFTVPNVGTDFDVKERQWPWETNLGHGSCMELTGTIRNAFGLSKMQ